MSRQGLKRVSCGCGCIAYMTLAQLERYGLPVCPCGEPMAPESLEVCAAVMDPATLETLPAWRAMRAQADRSHHAQQSHHLRRHKLRDPEGIAVERAESESRKAAHARRLSGLVQYQAAAQAVAEMPF